MKRYSESERQAIMAEQEAKRMGETRLHMQKSSFLPVQVGMKKRALGQSEDRFLTLGGSGVAQGLPMPRFIYRWGMAVY